VSLQLPSVGDPATGLTEDAQALRDTVAALTGPVVVTAHSYGGVVATSALSGLANVAHVVYLCAFVLDAEESLSTVTGGRANWYDVRSDGLIDVINPAHVFYNDLTEAEADAAIAHLRPQSAKSFSDKLTAAAWRTIPSTYVVATDDNAFPPRAQRQMSQRCGTRYELDASHSPFLSNPDYVADLLRKVESA
jgi:pimeloyl-ACP methyl ester carboxylesterase